MTRSPVLVLTSVCRLMTFCAVISLISASKAGRPPSSNSIRTCFTRERPFWLASILARLFSAGVRTPRSRTKTTSSHICVLVSSGPRPIYSRSKRTMASLISASSCPFVFTSKSPCSFPLWLTRLAVSRLVSCHWPSRGASLIKTRTFRAPPPPRTFHRPPKRLGETTGRAYYEREGRAVFVNRSYRTYKKNKTTRTSPASVDLAKPLLFFSGVTAFKIHLFRYAAGLVGWPLIRIS